MSQTIRADMTVRELAGRHAAAREVFEKHGIDYCCGGAMSLAQAAVESRSDLAGLLEELRGALARAPGAAGKASRDWLAAGVTELASHILNTHHEYMKKVLPRIREALGKVRAAHAAAHGAMLAELQQVFDALDAEISAHLLKEEQVLFPYIIGFDFHLHKGLKRPRACFNTVRGPIAQMEAEHVSAGAALAALRRLTDNYTPPPDACPTFKALYDDLRQMEADLHEHIHLENNILFPLAVAQETPDVT